MKNDPVYKIIPYHNGVHLLQVQRKWFLKTRIKPKISFIEWLVNVYDLLPKTSFKVKINTLRKIFTNSKITDPHRVIRKANIHQVYNQCCKADSESNDSLL